MVKIVHYRNRCIGCNSCVEIAPAFWKMDDGDGKSSLKGSVKKKEVEILEITHADVEENEMAAKDCPVNIIHVLK